MFSRKHQLLIRLGAHVNLIFSGSWNVTGGWAQKFGKLKNPHLWLRISIIINITNTIPLTSPWGRVIWNMVWRWPLCSPFIQFERSSSWTRLAGNLGKKSTDPIWRTNSEERKMVTLALQDLELNWIYLIVCLNKIWHCWAYCSVFLNKF